MINSNDFKNKCGININNLPIQYTVLCLVIFDIVKFIDNYVLCRQTYYKLYMQAPFALGVHNGTDKCKKELCRITVPLCRICLHIGKINYILKVILATICNLSFCN